MRFLLYCLSFFAIGLISLSDIFTLFFSLGTTMLKIFFLPFSMLGLLLYLILSTISSKFTNSPISTFITPQRPRSRGRPRKTNTKVHSFFALPLKTQFPYHVLGVFFTCIFIILPVSLFFFLQDLPHPTELTSRPLAQTTKIFDRNGNLLYEIYAAQNRTVVPLKDIPLSLQHATLAIEDKNFYHHPGFDIQAMMRALKKNMEGKSVQGGSTITQQLIKSSMLTPEQTIQRKIKEVILAFWAERIYNKDKILEMYFNQVPYGGTAWGVEAASEVYFNKNVRDLTLAQSAFLAGITSAPTLYSPYGSHPELWKKRQKEVLRRMQELKYITSAEALKAEKENLVFAKPQVAFHAPHFVAYIKDLLIQKYGLGMVEKGGLQVTTTLDLSVQEKTEEIVSEEVNNALYLNITNGAALITNPKNGDILAMVGSHDFYDPVDGKFNLTTALRQPGSTVKVITYATALENGFTAASIIEDSPITFTNSQGPSYQPVNYDGNYHGKVPLRIALASSLNIPAVKLLNQIGVSTMVEMGRAMGIQHWNKDLSEYGLSTTLGASETTMLDMATVNGTLANEGKRVDLNPFLKVTTANGKILEEKSVIKETPVLDQGVAFIISDILADNSARSMAFGPNSPLSIPGHRISVKTGTSDNKRDNWTIGYNQDYVVTVWVGNNDNSPMSPFLASGISGAAPIWNRIMTSLLTEKPEINIQIPQTVVKLPCFGHEEYFLRDNIKGCYFSFNTRRR